MLQLVRWALVVCLVSTFLSCSGGEQPKVSQEPKGKESVEAVEAEMEPGEICQSLSEVLQEYLDVAKEAMQSKNAKARKKAYKELKQMFKEDDKNHPAIRAVRANQDWRNGLGKFRHTVLGCASKFLECAKAEGMMRALIIRCEKDGGIE